MEAGEEFRYLVLALQREGNRQLTEALRPLGLTPSQAEVIQVLQQYQTLTLLQLGERLVCESGSPSRLITSMVEAGWVEKLPNPDDGRAVLLRLTPAAEAVLPALNAVEHQFNQQAANYLEMAGADVILERLRAVVEASPGGQALVRRKHHR